ncbi:hypothetical protein CL634_06765 [bacterium]|nr:hypothetical protein [bacterium]
MTDERQFLKMVRHEYKSRLLEALSEVEIIDKQGNILVSPDLKVRHKKSGYEYTIDDVVVTGDEDVEIVLRAPEDPRIDPPGSEELLGAPPMEAENALLGEQDPAGDADEEEEVLFVVNKEEFEKEYEVK